MGLTNFPILGYNLCHYFRYLVLKRLIFLASRSNMLQAVKSESVCNTNDSSSSSRRSSSSNSNNSNNQQQQKRKDDNFGDDADGDAGCDCDACVY